MKIFLPRADDTPLATVDAAPIDLFKLHNAGGADFVDHPDDAEIVVLFEEWRTQFWQYAEALTRDPLFAAHWRKFYTVNCDDLGRGFLPGCYTSLNPRNFEPRLHRPCAYPFRYNQLTSEATGGTKAKYLFSFRGADFSHPIRRKIFRLFDGDARANVVCVQTAFHGHDEAQKRAYIHDILSSSFVLCPRGWSPATYRLFEVMELGRCPVIISDDWLPIDGPRWEDFSIRIAESDIARLPAILSSRESEAERLGHSARAAWEAHFSEPAKFRAMLAAISDLHRRRDDVDYRERWRTRAFWRANGWLLHQRIAARARKLLERQ